MHILITGAAGMVGRKLTERLAADKGAQRQADRQAHAGRRVGAGAPAGFTGKVEAYAADVSRAGAAAKLVAGPAGRDLPSRGGRLGRSRDGFREGLPRQSRHACATCSKRSARPAAAIIRRSCSPRRSRCSARRSRMRSTTNSIHTPLTSYGTQKGICELLLADYTRKGFLDGVGIRLPTICVRPARRTRRRRASSPTSSASRSPARKRCCRSRRA